MVHLPGDREPRRPRMRFGYFLAAALSALTLLVFWQTAILPSNSWRDHAASLGSLFNATTPVHTQLEAGQKAASEVEAGEQKVVVGTLNDSAGGSTARRIPLEAHIMSKSLDTKDCLLALVLPTMQRVVDKVDFTLSYVGIPVGDTGVECQHGPAECMGNIIELCAAQLYPDPKSYLGFTMCLEYNYGEIPSQNLVEDCALEHALDIDKLNACAVRDDGEFGVDLLRHSVQHSSAAGVSEGCTVRLDNKVYCVRDNGRWTDCPAGPGANDLIIAIEKLYRQG